MLPLPPEPCPPKSERFSSASSTCTRDQSASISSARIIANAVFTPWPMSGFLDQTVICPFGSSRT